MQQQKAVTYAIIGVLIFLMYVFLLLRCEGACSDSLSLPLTSLYVLFSKLF